MNTETLHVLSGTTEGRYVDSLFTDIISYEESFRQLPYFDDNDIATIGYGVNIEVPGYMTLILNQLGIVNSQMTPSDIINRTNDFIQRVNAVTNGDDGAFQFLGMECFRS